MKHGTHPPHLYTVLPKTTHPNKKHPYGKNNKKIVKKNVYDPW